MTIKSNLARTCVTKVLFFFFDSWLTYLYSLLGITGESKSGVIRPVSIVLVFKKPMKAYTSLSLVGGIARCALIRVVFFVQSGVMAQQYGYGYGYQATYNYAQPAAVPQPAVVPQPAAVPQAQTYGGYGSPAATGRSTYPQNQPTQQQQPPSVGYSSYQGSQSSVGPSPSK